jgi:hypothetical protein
MEAGASSWYPKNTSQGENCEKDATYTLGYSDFHNLMGFTSKKMPNNIL